MKIEDAEIVHTQGDWTISISKDGNLEIAHKNDSVMANFAAWYSAGQYAANPRTVTRGPE